MEIDPHNLPSEVNLLQQIVLQLLQAVEDKDQLLARVQHQLVNRKLSGKSDQRTSGMVNVIPLYGTSGRAAQRSRCH
jgi:hypothetical protein